MIRLGSLFTGIGGLDLGFDLAASKAGVQVDHVFQVEFEAWRRRLLAVRWPDCIVRFTDVKEVEGKRGCIDVLIGGFP